MAEPSLPEVAKDIAKLIELKQSNELSSAIVRQLVAVSCWWASNPHGRRITCKHWSVEAVNEWRRDPRWTKGRFSHDHVVPRAYIARKILSLELPTASEIERWLNLSFECVLTVSEHSSIPYTLKANMPPGWDIGGDIWARYKRTASWPGIARYSGASPF